MEVEILKTIQSIACPFLDVLFQIITALGETAPAILIVGFLYWCQNKTLGRRLMFTVGFSAALNGSVKGLVNRPRPSEADGIRKLRSETATGSSFPSGHSQNISSLLTCLGLWFQKRFFWVLSAVIMLLVGFSRLYLGAHYPTDVLAGLVFGGLSAVLISVCMDRFAKPGREAPFMLICAAVFLPFAVYFGFFVSPEIQALQNDFFKAYGLLAGIGAGTLLEEHFVRFSTDHISAGKKVLRMLTGLVFLLPVYILPKMFFPSGVFFAALRYFLVAVGAVCGVPALFGLFHI